MKNDIVNQYLAQTKMHGTVRKPAILADGSTISIQASKYHYCIPRENNVEYYTEVEIMPNVFDPNDDNPEMVSTTELSFYIMSKGGIKNMENGLME